MNMEPTLPMDGQPLTYDQWEERYQPLQNPFTTNGSYGNTLYDTHGPEGDAIRAACQDGRLDRVWTLIDVDGETMISAGYHHVNRLGYFLTEKPAENEFIEVLDD